MIVRGDLEVPREWYQPNSKKWGVIAYFWLDHEDFQKVAYGQDPGGGEGVG